MAMAEISRKLFKGSALQTLNYFAQVIVAFFLVPFIIKSFGDRLYGFWSLVGAIIGYYGLLDFGFEMTVNRFMAKSIGADDRDEGNRIFNTSIFIFSGIGIVAFLATVVLALLAPYLFENPSDSDLFWKVILIVGINLAIEFPLKVYVGILDAILRYDVISGISMLRLLLRTALTVLILVLGYKVLALALVTVLAGVPSKILHIYYVRKHMPHLRLQISQWTSTKVKKLFSYSSLTFVAKLAEELKFNVDVFVITAFLSLATVTHYRIACIPVGYFRALVVTMLGIFFPLYCQQHGAGDHEALKKSFIFSSKMSVYIAGFLGFILIALGHPFVERWMGVEYLDAYPILVILTVGGIIDIGQVNSPAVLFATSNHRMFAVYTLAEGFFNIILSLLLVKPYGMMGVALGTLVPLLAVKLVIQPLHVSKAISIKYTDYIVTMMKTVRGVAVALIIPTMISIVFEAPKYLNLFAISFLSAVSYMVVLWFIELSRSEKEALMLAIAPRLIQNRIRE